MTERYIDVSQEAGAAVMARNIQGPVVMLNMLRFREVADYSASPELAPAQPISGREAYEKYMASVTPLLNDCGSKLEYIGEGGHFLIGPTEARWDLILLVRHKSLGTLMSFASNDAYAAVKGHRTAALEDSRLLPLVDPG